MNDTELIESLIYSTQHAAGFVLRRHRRVLPFCVQFAPAEDPLVDFYFPREAQPQASFEEQFALAEARARRFAALSDTCALAFVTEVTQGKQRFMLIQAETRTLAQVLRYPIRKTWLGLATGKAEEAEGFVVGPFLRMPDRSVGRTITNGETGDAT